MIHVNLKGGLGNMLFQVAAGLAFAKRINTVCVFPNLLSHLGYLNNDHEYNPKLQHAQQYLAFFSRLYRTQGAVNSTVSFPLHYEDKKVGRETLIEGFFQSEKYFADQRDHILYQLKPHPTVEKIAMDKYGELLNQRTASLHVRRGDYLKFGHIYHIPDKSYYEAALDLLKDEVEHVLIFSDDIPYCKEMFGEQPYMTFIENEQDFIELILMSKCDHNIIANSSFSWWGAWMNQNPDKKVIAPSKWFVTDSLQEKDIIPESWIKI